MDKKMSRKVGKEEMVRFVCGGEGLFSAVAVQDMSREGVGRYLLSRYRGILRWDGKELATEWLVDVRDRVDCGVPLFEAAQKATTKMDTTARRERRRAAKTGIPFQDSPDGATVSTDPARNDRIKRRRRRIIIEGRRKSRAPSLTRALLGMMSDGHLAAINAEEYVSFFAGAESAEIAQTETVIDIENLLRHVGDDGTRFIMAILDGEARTWRQAARVAGVKRSRAREIIGEVGHAYGFNISMMAGVVSKGM